MARKRRSRRNVEHNNTQEPAKVPWYKRVWVVAGATSALVSAILIQGSTMLQNARVLPKELLETSNQFQSWVKEDEEWTGHWSSFPEGIVDMVDMELSNVDLEITILSKNGEINGTIATRKICESIPIVDFVLLRGKVDNNKAEVIVWDIVGGEKRDFASLTLIRDDYVMTVIPKEGMTYWFPSQARIARGVIDSSVPHPSRSFCDKEKKEFFEEIIQDRKENG